MVALIHTLALPLQNNCSREGKISNSWKNQHHGLLVFALVPLARQCGKSTFPFVSFPSSARFLESHVLVFVL